MPSSQITCLEVHPTHSSCSINNQQLFNVYVTSEANKIYYIKDKKQYRLKEDSNVYFTEAV